MIKKLLCESRVKTIVQVDPRSWIALIFGSQVLGSLLLSMVIGLKAEEIGFSILLLLVGSVVALWFRYRSGFYEPTFLQRWIPAFIYMLFIFSLSHRSFEGISVSVSTNSFHPVGYATLGIFLSWAWHPVLIRSGPFSLCFRVLSAGLAYGVLDEFHQSLIPGRFPSSWDIFLDFIGLCVGCALFLAVTGTRNRIREREQ